MDWLTGLCSAAGAAMTAFGVFQAFAGINSLLQRRQASHSMNDDSEWWQILTGALWVALGSSAILVQAVNGLAF